MIKFDLIPSWVYWIVIGALLVGLGAQEIRAAGLRADVSAAATALAKEKTARAEETTQRATLALANANQIKQLQADHAAAQQAKENQYATRIKELEADRRADAATTVRLRNTIATYTARDRRPGETDTAAADRYADRLALVGGLLSEGVDLVAESRAVIAQRDIEVMHLLGQIQIDRAACSAPAGASGVPKP